MSTRERVNGYVCQTCGETTWTVDVDEGVTPFMFACFATPDCRGPGYSRFYRVPENHPEPTVEWYRMTNDEARRLDRKHPGTWDHHRQGGLNYRLRRPPFDSETESSVQRDEGGRE